MRSRAELEKLIERAEIMSKIQSEDCAGKDEWKPITSPASGFEERAELFRAIAAAISECLPEERVGACPCGMCEHVSGKWCELYPTMPDGEPEAGPVPWKHCAWCGAHLGADGVARRNADAGRVERVRQALEEWCIDGFVPEEYIRAALDGPQDNHVSDDAPKPSVRDIKFRVGGGDDD